LSLNWKTAVREALGRYSERHTTVQIDRAIFLDEEQLNIVNATESSGKTPGQTISRVLQELRDEGVLFFSSSGDHKCGLINLVHIKPTGWLTCPL
jgi:hypothetical protein